VNAKSFARACLLSLLVSAAPVPSATVEGAEPAGDDRGARLFFRIVGSRNNAPLLPKTRSVCARQGQDRVGNTGMADAGFTEFPFCRDTVDFGFLDNYAIYPRIVSGARIDEGHVNSADIVMDHVYQPDGCVWGYTGREFVQTFVATADTEMVSVTLLVASPPDRFCVQLHEGGPAGRPVGGVHTFFSGHSMEHGTVRWAPGEAPLAAGHTYALRFWSLSGRAWTPYLHSLGDAYAEGCLHVDGRIRADSDLAAWVVLEPDDLKRGLVPDADHRGWVYDGDRVWIVPRTPNITLLWVNVRPVHLEPFPEHGACDLVAEIQDASGRRVAAPKRALTGGAQDGSRAAAFLFADEECPVEPGQRYAVVISVAPRGAESPNDARPLRHADWQVRVYGRPEPGALPAIYNLQAAFPKDERLHLSWRCTTPARTRVVLRGDGMTGAGHKTQHIDLPPGTHEAETGVWPGHTYEFELIAFGPSGLTWRTPTYQVRAPRKEEITAITYAEPPYPESFVHLAPARVARGAEPGPLRYLDEVPVVNGDFEEGCNGWTSEPPDRVKAYDVGPIAQSIPKKHGIDTRWGEHVAGIAHAAPRVGEQVFEESRLTQSIETRPGHVYLLAAMVRTAIDGSEGGDQRLRGDARVRLVVDPSDGDGRVEQTQWYWTDDAWERFTLRWTARTSRSVVGFEFFRWRDLPFAGAFVDEVHVYDLGPAPVPALAPAPIERAHPAMVLAEPRVEAQDKVEAYLQAPEGYVITGLGARAHYDNITTLWLRIQPLRPDGTLGPAEHLRAGWEMDSHLEAKVELPEGYVATGFGAGIAPEWDVKRLGVWARPLRADGTLGEEKLFRGGIDLESGFERSVRLEAGRVLTAAGLNCMLNDVNGIAAASRVVRRTAHTEEVSGSKAREP